MAGTVTALCC